MAIQQGTFANTLFAAATKTLNELLADPKYLGARPGILACLHTWSQTLAAHVHLHVLVTAGGLDEKHQWQVPKKDCLLPRKVLMIKFRGAFRAMLLSQLNRGELLPPPGTSIAYWRSQLHRVGRMVWNVKLFDRYAHGSGVATYLAQYMRGGPIGNHRLLSVKNDRVLFRYRLPSSEHHEKPQHSLMRMDAMTFLTRLLEHTPPRGFQTVRGYGLYSGNQHSQIAEHIMPWVIASITCNHQNRLGNSLWSKLERLILVAVRYVASYCKLTATSSGGVSHHRRH